MGSVTAQNKVYKKNSASPYFLNGMTDFLLMGGLSIFFFFVVRGLGISGRQPWAYQSAAWLVWVINWPHFSATSYRLYHSQTNLKQYPMTALLIPFLVGIGVVTSLLDQTGVAPYFVKLFYIWSPYHFSGQTLGLTLLYARRQGISITRAPRFFLSAFIFSTYLYSTVRAEVSTADTVYYNVHIPSFGVPQAFATTLGYWMIVTGVICAFWFIRESKKRLQEGRSIIGSFPWIVILPAISQFIWFVPGSGVASFQEFVPAFHSLQYLFIAWSMHVFEGTQQSEQKISYRQYLGVKGLTWGASNFIGGALLFYFFPRWAAWGFDLPQGFAEGVVISGVQIHHFFVDGVIWKLKRQDVVSPLMMSFDQLSQKFKVSA